MNSVTKEIFAHHELRKTKAQRKAFRDYALSYARSKGYEVKVEKGSHGAQNLIVGNPKTADVVYTAHYDTCAVMPIPNFITPKCLPIYILYQFVLTFLVYIIPVSVMIGARHVLAATDSDTLFLLMLSGGYLLLVLFTVLLIAGPANKHTANDNTSGVALLLELMDDMPTELRSKVAYIFFDFEERGLIGSKSYAAKHKDISKKMLVVNFDCVSDGKNILIAPRRHASGVSAKLSEAFKSNESFTVDIATKGVFYPSDQYSFPRGVGVAALKKTKGGLLYMNRIHTPRDTVYDEENIEFLKNGAIEFARII